MKTFAAFVGQTVNVLIIIATIWSALTTTIAPLRWLCWLTAGICVLVVMAAAAGATRTGGKS